LNAQRAAAQEVGVDHGGGDVFVTEELLGRPDVGPRLQEVGGSPDRSNLLAGFSQNGGKVYVTS
jgi:hypothetical protein